MDIPAEIPFNWRDPQDYAVLLNADRSLFAWEWLRRDTAYRKAAAMTSAAPGRGHVHRNAQRFGLLSFEPADLPVPFARPLWCSEINPQVLVGELSADPSGEGTFEIEWLRHLAYLKSDGATDYLLLTDGLRTIRIDAPAGGFAGKPLCLQLRFDRLLSGELLALRQLIALVRCGRFARSLHLPEPRARRWIQQLRALDAVTAGADLREIAEVILGRSTAGPGWRSRDPSLRSQAQRLVRSARALAAGGFYRLLAPPSRLGRQFWIARPSAERGIQRAIAHERGSVSCSLSPFAAAGKR